MNTELQFYADEATYEESAEPHPPRFASGVVPIEADRGSRARAVLAPSQQEDEHYGVNRYKRGKGRTPRESSTPTSQQEEK